MAVHVVMPKLGLNMTEGTLINWLVDDGAQVSKGQGIFELETEKVTNEVEAVSDGILHHKAQPGDVVAVGVVVGYILQLGEQMPVETIQAEPETSNTSSEGNAEQVANAAETNTIISKEKLSGSGLTGGEVLATPAARRVAKKLNVDISKVKPSRGQRVSIDDVEKYASAINGQAGDSIADTRVLETVPIKGVRAVIARRMSESSSNTAAVTLTTEVDATELVALRAKLNSAEKSSSISYNAILMYITAAALREYPGVNARIDGQSIILLENIHIGIAVDTERGLLVPVIQVESGSTVEQVNEKSLDIVEKARNGTCKPEDLSGGTFTITNLGMYEIDAFTPIINLPETAVLGVGRIVKKPTAVDDDIRIRSRMILSLTFDHRIIDGGPAARFLQRVKNLIEKPNELKFI